MCEEGTVVGGTVPGAVVVVAPGDVVVVAPGAVVVVVVVAPGAVVVVAPGDVVVVAPGEVVVVAAPAEVVVVAAPAEVVVVAPVDVVVVVPANVVVVPAKVVVVPAKVVVVPAKVVLVPTAVVVVALEAHVGLVMVLSFRVTAPLRAKTRPSTVAPLSRVADVKAMIVPTKVVVVPSVAELPTCQNTLHAWAPLIRLTVLLEAEISVEPAWKMNTELASFSPFNVTVPVRLMEEAALYTPGARLCPPRSVETAMRGARLAASR